MRPTKSPLSLHRDGVGRIVHAERHPFDPPPRVAGSRATASRQKAATRTAQRRPHSCCYAGGPGWVLEQPATEASCSRGCARRIAGDRGQCVACARDRARADVAVCALGRRHRVAGDDVAGAASIPDDADVAAVDAARRDTAGCATEAPRPSRCGHGAALSDDALAVGFRLARREARVAERGDAPARGASSRGDVDRQLFDVPAADRRLAALIAVARERLADQRCNVRPTGPNNVNANAPSTDPGAAAGRSSRRGCRSLV